MNVLYDKQSTELDIRRLGSDRLSRGLSQSIIGAERFHCRVRNGIECFTFAITTKPSYIQLYSKLHLNNIALKNITFF